MTLMEQLALWAPAAICVCTSIFVYGRLTEKVGTHEKRLDAHGLKLEDHGTRLTKLDAWHEGYTAGTGTHRG